jgi:glycosyltransferase involved in cell wall biosynthesis
MKVGLLAHDFVNWGGGLDFLRLVIDSLLAVPRVEPVEFHLLIPDSGPRLAWRHIRRQARQRVKSLGSGKRAGSSGSPSADIIAHAFAEFRGRITSHHIDIGHGALKRAARRLDLAVLLPAVHTLGREFPFPWLGYAYDFQHRYLPENFSPSDCKSRDEHFSDLFTHARGVIVNSKTSAKDVARFVPEATARVFTLPLAPAPDVEWLDDKPEVLPRYKMAAPYFLISNQFWAHKEHLTAFEAFREVAATNRDVVLICTGSTEGARDPGYFPGLMTKLKSWGLEERVRIMGLIPKRDQIEIMKNACAVVQPTRFEGDAGGGSVYDAISLGVPSIVSDIPVNLEAEGCGAVFFPLGDAKALAGKMRAQLVIPRVHVPREELIALGRRRRAAAGAVLWDAIDYVR